MREDRPSATAFRVAALRAEHQVLDKPRVFEDPLALSIVGSEAMAVQTSGEEEAEAEADGGNRSRYLRAFLVARSRYAEDQLALAMERGAGQYVILGAGLDTFAYRNPFPGLRVFEIDHPNTQLWKRRRLEDAAIAVPESLTFVPVDFEKQSFVDGLLDAGFRAADAAFFSWLGVTPYLAKDTVLATLRSIISMSPENGAVFDFALPRSSLDARSRLGFDLLAARVAAAGEPFQGFFDPGELAAELRSMGFRHLEDLGSNQINSRYFKDRADGLCVAGNLGHLMCAWG